MVALRAYPPAFRAGSQMRPVRAVSPPVPRIHRYAHQPPGFRTDGGTRSRKMTISTLAPPGYDISQEESAGLLKGETGVS